MSNLWRSVYPFLCSHALSFLALGLSVPVWAFGGWSAWVWILPMIAASEIVIRDFQGRIRRANEQKCFLDEQLIQSQKLASIGELSSGIAHEINNPLAIIGQEVEWMGHLLKKESIGDPREMEELKGSMKEISRQVDRCREITHKLLDFARKREPLLQGVDINRLVEDMARLVEREATHHGIRIVREYRKDLPVVYTDAPLIRQVILNLLNNATYAVQKDGTITVRTRRADPEAITVTIEDTGCGISKEHLNKIFDPFFTTKPPGKGTGLGLSLCHGIVTKLGGQISVSSEVGKGSKFTLRLPAQSKKGEA
ncbi:MAG TPA: ATP-binding protein [Syntrophobacteraceae bacterium]|mgnify:CR=1 FL=1|nr:ATP-binding protein [Syntrophobacteraceae bacterium]